MVSEVSKYLYNNDILEKKSYRLFPNPAGAAPRAAPKW